MKKSTTILAFLLCTSSIITNASPIIEYDINETRIYKPNFYSHDIAMTSAALCGFGASLYCISELSLDPNIDRENPLTHVIIAVSVGAFAFSLKNIFKDVLL
jgi:hypothetical protein